MGPEIGDVFLEVHADTRGLSNEIRRAATLSGREGAMNWSKEFDRQLDSQLSRTGTLIRKRLSNRAEMDKAGSISGVNFGDALGNAIRTRLSSFDFDLADAVVSGDWSKAFGKFDSLDAAYDQVRSRLEQIRDTQRDAFTPAQFNNALKSLNAYRDTESRILSAEKDRRTSLAGLNNDLANMVRNNKDLNTQYEVQRTRELAPLTEKVRSLATEQESLSKTLGRLRTSFKDGTIDADGYRTSLGRMADEVHRNSVEIVKVNRDLDAHSEKFVESSKDVDRHRSTLSRLTGGYDDLRFALSKADIDIDRVGRSMEVETRRLGTNKKAVDDNNKSWRKYLNLLTLLKDGWSNVDNTVQLVIGLVVSSAQEIMTALSAALGYVVAIAGNLVSAASSIVTLGTGAAGFVTAIALGVSAWKDMAKNLDSFKKAQAALSDSWKGQAKDFEAAWGGPISNLLRDLASTIGSSGIGKAFGGAAAQITDAFDKVLKGPTMKAFLAYFKTDIPDAVGTIGSALAPLVDSLVGLATASTPALKLLAGWFAEWAQSVSDAVEAGNASGALSQFFKDSADRLKDLMKLIGTFGHALWNVFTEGSSTGDSFIGMLQKLADKFLAWTQSVEGKNALAQFFSDAELVMSAFGDAIGALSQGLADLVTPESVASTVDLFESIAKLAPLLSDFLAAVSKARILDIFVEALITLGKAIEPLLPSLGDLLATLSGGIIQTLETLTPALSDLFTSLAPFVQVLITLLDSLFAALQPLLPALADALVGALDALLPAIEGLLPIITTLLTTLGTEFVNILAVLGPYIADLINGFVTGLLPAFTNLLPVIQQIIPTVQAFLDAITPLLPQIVELATETGTSLMDAFVALAPLLIQLLQLLADTAPTIVTLMSIGIKPLSAAMAVLGPAIQVVGTILGVLFDGIRMGVDVVGDLVDAFLNGKDIVGTVGTVIGDIVGGIARAFDNLRDAIGKIHWPTPPKWVTDLGEKIKNLFASGGTVLGPTRALIGEAGPEAVVPLNRPLSQVDPSVRWLSAIAQGQTPMASGGVAGGRSVLVESGAIVVQPMYADAHQVANSVLDGLVARVG